MSDQIDELIQDILGNGITDPVGSPEFTRKIQEAQKRRDTLYEKQETDKPNYGFSPENPIMTSSVKDSSNYLSRLRTADELSLTWDRLGCITLVELHGLPDVIVDEYQLFLDGEKYRKIYICPYGRSGDTAPRGMCLVDLPADSSKDTISPDESEVKESAEVIVPIIPETSDNAILDIPVVPTVPLVEKEVSEESEDSTEDGIEQNTLSEDNNSDEFPMTSHDETEKTPTYTIELIDCANCHSRIRKDAQFCRVCGTKNPFGKSKFNYDFVNIAKNYEKKDNEQKHGIRNVIIIVLVLAAVGALIYWLVTSGASNSKKKESVNSASSVVSDQNPEGIGKTDDADNKDHSVSETALQNVKYGGYSITDLSIGQVVVFGKYEQDNNLSHMEPLEWVVIKKYDDRSCVELITRKVIDAIHYGIVNDKWSTSNVRQWMNGFYLKAFSNDEQKFVLSTDTKGINGDIQTTDKAFSLMLESVNNLLPKNNPYRIGIATEYVKSISNFTVSDSGVCNWQTRDPGMIISYNGDNAYISTTNLAGVRPAVYVRIDKDTPIGIE